MKVRLRHLGPSSRHGGAAWLAIVALLVDMLLPAGIGLAMPPVAPAAIGYCGSAPRPDHPPAVPDGRHCIYCLVAPIGPTPEPPPAPAPLRFIGVAVAPSSGHALTRPQRPYAAAQPRGPPGSADFA